MATMWSVGVGRITVSFRPAISTSAISVYMADRDDMASLPCEAEHRSAAKPAQAAGDDCDALFNKISLSRKLDRQSKGAIT